MKRHPMPLPVRRWAVPLVALLAWPALAVPAGRAIAATVNVILPTRSAGPGATVDLPIVIDRSLAGLSVVAIDYRLALDPAVIASATVLGDGLVQAWGPPTVNANSSFVAVAAAGVTPLSAEGTLLQTVQVTLKSGLPDQDLPLTLPVMRFNEGTPTVAVTAGVLRVRGGVGVEDVPAGFGLAAPRPNPASRELTGRFSLPAPATRARVSVYSVDGRVVRDLVDGAAAAGAHPLRWDLRDAGGRPVPAGLYLIRLDDGARTAVRRVMVIR